MMAGRVLQLVIEERSVSAPLTCPACSNDADCSLRLHEGIASDLNAGENIPRGGDAVAVNW